MPLYRYDSFSRRGERVKGTIDTSSLQAAKQILQGQGLMPTDIVLVGTETKKFSFARLLEGTVDLRTKIVFTKQLSVLLKSGVPLLQALELLSEQFEKRFKRVLIEIKDNIKAGESFASSLSKYPDIFSNVYVQLIKAGEASGKLSAILERLTDYLYRTEETKKRIKKATSYPIFMLGFSFAVIVALLTFLVPRITGIFLQMGKPLPGPTMIVKNISDFLLTNFLYILIFLGIFGSIIFYWLSTPSGKYKLDEIFLKFPLTAYFVRTKAVVQFCKTLGLLLESGVNLSEALDIVCNIVDNKVLVKKLKEAQDKIIKEGKISKYLKETGIFPTIAIYMIDTGEQSGKLDQMLLSVGQDYDNELQSITDSLVSKIGPAVLMFAGVVIAFIVIAIFLPIVEMSDISGF